MPSIWNSASVYFVMIKSSKMNTTSFSHVTCIMTCDLHSLITPHRMFPILIRGILMIKWYIWCHAIRVLRAMEMRRNILYKKDWALCCNIICPHSLTLHVFSCIFMHIDLWKLIHVHYIDAFWSVCLATDIFSWLIRQKYTKVYRRYKTCCFPIVTCKPGGAGWELYMF